MKGIFILTFHKKPGAFVDREYPHGITDQLGIDATDQNKVYSLHRMRNTLPNFLFLKAKNVTIASFFSGFDLKHYIGRPNQCVSVILDNHENPTIWEDKLRRLAYELLPVLAEIRGEEIIMTGLSTDIKYHRFDQLLAEKLEDLKAGRVEPLYEGEAEVIVGDGTHIDTISDMRGKMTGTGTRPQNLTLTAEDIAKAAEMAQTSPDKSAFTPAPKKEQKEDSIAQATAQMEAMEKETLRNEIRRLNGMLKDQNSKIQALESQLRDEWNKEVAAGSESSAEVGKIRGEYEAIIAAKEEELEKWRTKVSELNENNFINQDTIAKMTEMTMQQTMEMQEQAQKIMELKKQLKSLEAANVKTDTIPVDEVASLRSHAVELEETLKTKLTELDAKTTQTKELYDRIQRLEAEKSKLEDEIVSLKHEIQEKSNALKAAEEKIRSLEITAEALSDTTEEPVSAGVNVPDPAEMLKMKSLEEEVARLKIELATKDSELINAKKIVKVQRREIDHLQALAGLK
jgi:chromosome segregation ATPase